MNKRAVKYIAVFLSVFVGISSLLSIAVYMFDPQNVYRWNDSGTRVFSPIYSTAGSINNYDYNYAIIGSSMVQNFDADEIASELDCKPIKITIGAMTPNELLYVYDKLQDVGKAKQYVINIDIHRIAAAENVEPDVGRFADYMFDRNGVSQFKYLLGYETWFRFMPIDIAFTLVNKLNISVPYSLTSSISENTDINEMCRWYTSEPPGKETVLENYMQENAGFNEGDNSTYYDNAPENVDLFFTHLTKTLGDDENITIILPPYAVLYWTGKSEEELETLIDIRNRISANVDKYENIRLLDFQSLELTNDLDNYYDVSHFSLEIQSMMAKALGTDEYSVDAAEVVQNSEEIRYNAIKFFKENLK